MAFFEKNINDMKVLFLMFIGIPLIASTNIDCRGKSFHCLNSTHFMICVDLGGGVSYTVDDFVIPCPPPTVCKSSNNFECEMPLKINVIQTTAPPVTSAPQQKEKETTREDVNVNTIAFNTEPELHIELSTVATQETSTGADVISLQPDKNKNVIETNLNATESPLVTTGLLELTTEFFLDIMNDTVPILKNETLGDSGFDATSNISNTNSTDMRNETKLIDQIYITESVISDKPTEVTVNEPVLSEITVESRNITEHREEFLVTSPEETTQETTVSSLSESSVPTTETGSHRNVTETNQSATESALVTNGSLELTTVYNLVIKNDSESITLNNATLGDSEFTATSNISDNNSTDMKNETILTDLQQETTVSSLSERPVLTTETGTHRNVIETNLYVTESTLVTSASLELTTMSNLVIRNDSEPITLKNTTLRDSAFAETSNFSNTNSTDTKKKTNRTDQVYTTESVLNEKLTEVIVDETALSDITVVSNNATENREEFLVTSPEDRSILDVLVQEKTVSSLPEHSVPATETGTQRNIMETNLYTTESTLVTNHSLELTTVPNLVIRNDSEPITLKNTTLRDSAFAETSNISNTNSTDTKSETNLTDTTESVLNDKPTEVIVDETVFSNIKVVSNNVTENREEFLVTSPKDTSILDVLVQETTVSSLSERSVPTTETGTQRNIMETNLYTTESTLVTNHSLELTTVPKLIIKNDSETITLNNVTIGGSAFAATSIISNTNSTNSINETNLIDQVNTTESVINDKPTKVTLNETVPSEITVVSKNVTEHPEEFFVTSPENRSVLDVVVQETTVSSLPVHSVPTVVTGTHRNVIETNLNATESSLVTNSSLELTTASELAIENDTGPIPLLDNLTLGDSALVVTPNISNTNATNMKNKTNPSDQVYTTESVINDKPTEVTLNETVPSEITVVSKNVTEHREELLVTSPEDKYVSDVLVQKTTVSTLSERSLPTTEIGIDRNVIETNLYTTENPLVTNGSLKSTTVSNLVVKNDSEPITLNNITLGVSTFATTSIISNTNSNNSINETNLIDQVNTTESVINDKPTKVTLNETGRPEITVVSKNVAEHRKEFFVTSPEDKSILDVLVQETTVSSLSDRSVPSVVTGTHINIYETNLNETESTLVTNGSLELTTVSNLVIKNDSVPITLNKDLELVATFNISKTNSTNMRIETNLTEQVYTTESVINDKPTEVKVDKTVLSEVIGVTAHREEFITSPEDKRVLGILKQETTTSSLFERSVPTTVSVTDRNINETNLNATESNLVKNGSLVLTVESKLAINNDTEHIPLLDVLTLADSALITTPNIVDTIATNIKNVTNLFDQVYTKESVINDEPTEGTVNETVPSEITVESKNVTEHREELLVTLPEDISVSDVLMQKTTTSSLSERSVPRTETGTHRNIIEKNLNATASTLVTNGLLTIMPNLVIKNDLVPMTLHNAISADSAFAATSNIPNTNSTNMKNGTNLIQQVYTTESVINNKPTEVKVNTTALSEVSDVTAHREKFLVTSPEDISVLHVLQQETMVSVLTERSVRTTESVTHRSVIETNFIATESNLVTNDPLKLTTASKLATDTVLITNLDNSTLGDSALVANSNISNTNSVNMPIKVTVNETVLSESNVESENITEHREEFLVTSPEDRGVLDILVQETTVSSLPERSVPTTETGSYRNVIETNLNATESALFTNGSLKLTTVSVVIKNDSESITLDNAFLRDPAFAATSNISNTNSTDMKNETNIIDQVYTKESVINDKPTIVTVNGTVLSDITNVSKNVTENREEFLVTSPEDRSTLDVLVQETTVSSLSERSVPTTETWTQSNKIEKNLDATESTMATNGLLELTTVFNMVVNNDSRPITLNKNELIAKDSATIPNNVMDIQGIEYTTHVLSKEPSNTVINLHIGGDDTITSFFNTEQAKASTLQSDGNAKDLATSENIVNNVQQTSVELIMAPAHNNEPGGETENTLQFGGVDSTSFPDAKQGKHSILLVENVEFATNPATTEQPTIKTQQNGIARIAPVSNKEPSDIETTLQVGGVALNSSIIKTKQGKDNEKSVNNKDITLKLKISINDEQSEIEHITSVPESSKAVNTSRVDGVKQSNLSLKTEPREVNLLQNNKNEKDATNTQQNGMVFNTHSLSKELSDPVNTTQIGNVKGETFAQSSSVLRTEEGKDINIIIQNRKNEETISQSVSITNKANTLQNNINERIPFILENGEIKTIESVSRTIQNDPPLLIGVGLKSPISSSGQNNNVNAAPIDGAVPFVSNSLPFTNTKQSDRDQNIQNTASTLIMIHNDSTDMLQNYTQIVLITKDVSGTTSNEIITTQAPREFTDLGSSIAINSKKVSNTENENTGLLLNSVQNGDLTVIKTGKEINYEMKLQQRESQINIPNITQGKRNVTENVNIERDIEAAQTETLINLSDSNQPALNNMNVIDNGGRNEKNGLQNIEDGTLKIINSKDHNSTKVIEVIKTTINGQAHTFTLSPVPEDFELKKVTTTLPSLTMAANENTAPFYNTPAPDTLHINSAKPMTTYSTVEKTQVNILNSDSVPITMSTLNDNNINDFMTTPAISTISVILPGDGQQITESDDTFKLDRVDKISQDGNTRVSTTENIETITSVTGERVNIAITTTSYGEVMKNTYTPSAAEISTKSTTTKASEEPSTKFKLNTTVTHALPSFTVKRNNISATNGQRKISIEKGFNCQNRATGKYADNKDCSKFYICSGITQAIVGTCPFNTVFSEIRKQCTRNLSHCIRNNEFKCTSVGRFADYLKPTVYYICMRKEHTFIRYKLQCQKGYLLNRLTVTCYRHIQSTSKSTSSDISQSTTDKLSKENDAIKKSDTKNVKEEFECEDEGKFGDPNNCRGYYICKIKNKSDESYYQKYKKCDDDEVFHKEKKKCVDVNSYECRYCDSKTPNTYYVKVTSKHHSLTYKLQCQNGYYLNKTRVRCVKKPVSEITPRKAEKSNENGKTAECKAEGKFADPNDCRRYYICKEKYNSEDSQTRFRRKHKKCKSRKVFSEEKQKCIITRNIRCL